VLGDTLRDGDRILTAEQHEQEHGCCGYEQRTTEVCDVEAVDERLRCTADLLRRVVEPGREARVVGRARRSSQ
jgi:hypothetical protein